MSHVNIAVGNDFATFAELGFNFKPLQGNVSLDNNDSFLDKLLEVTNTQNTFLSTTTIDLFSIGHRFNKGFAAFSISEQIEAQLAFPRDLLRLLRDLDTDDIQQLQGRVYDLRDLQLNGTHYRTYNANYAYDLSSKLTVGVRLGFVQGLGNVRLEKQNYRVAVSQTDFEAMGELRARVAGLQFLFDEEAEDVSFLDYELAKGNSGLLAGFGAQYRLSPKLELAASVNNLGSIKWKKRIGESVLTETFTEPQENLGDYSGSLFEIASDTAAPYRTPLPRTLSLQGNYYVLPNISVSALLYSSSVNGIGSTSFSLAGNARLGTFLSATLAYHHIQNKPNIGLGASLNLGSLQLYAASDNAIRLVAGNAVSQMHWTGGIYLTFRSLSRKENLARLDALNHPMQEIEQSPDLATNEIVEESPDLSTDEIIEELATLLLNVLAEQEEITTETPVDSTPADEPLPALAQETVESFQPNSTVTEAPSVVAPPSPQLPEQTFPASPPARELPTAAPVPTPTISTPLQLPPNVIVFLELKQDANLQEEASHQSAIIRSMTAGTKVKLRESASAGWLKVSWGSKTGYLQAADLAVASDQYSNEYLALVEQLLQQKAIAPAETPTPTPAPIVEEVPTPVATELVASSSEQPSSQTGSLGSFFITQSTSFRRSPSSSAGVIRRFQEGDKVELVEKTNTDWWKVMFRREMGWVKAALLEEL